MMCDKNMLKIELISGFCPLFVTDHWDDSWSVTGSCHKQRGLHRPVTIIRTIVTNHRDEAIYVKIEFHKNGVQDKRVKPRME